MYFMKNLNDSIFGDVKSNYMDLFTRALFPDTYEEILQRVIAEYGQITSRKPQSPKPCSRSSGETMLNATGSQASKLKKKVAILRGWPRSPYANREYHFVRDEEDQLLHCRLKATSEMAMLAKRASFYQPDEIPRVGSVEGLDKLSEIRRFHEYYSHPSLNEMKRTAGSWFADTTITKEDIEEWHALEGKFCAGCLEGKLKEHARQASTKPLKATRPGENGVGDLMFIEGRHDTKTPFYIHVEVATKLIIGYSLKNKIYGEVYRAIEYIYDQHKVMNHKLERLTFDRESSIVVIQEDIEARGIRLTLKAAGQKVGLAEVSIRLVSYQGWSEGTLRIHACQPVQH